MRFVVVILASCFLLAEARGRYGHKKYTWHDRGPERREYDWSRNMDRSRGTVGRQWQSRFQMADVEALNHRGRLDDARQGPSDDANVPTEAMTTTTEEQSRWGGKQGGYYTNWQRQWADKKRYYKKKYGSFRWLPDATDERSDQRQRQNDTSQGAEGNERHRHGERDRDGHYRPSHGRHHNRSPEHHRGHKKHHERHDWHHHEHDRHHHEHDRHHHHHDSHDGRRHHGPHHEHHDHHRGHKGRWGSSSSEEDWSRNSNESSSGSHSWHKGKHHGRYYGGHKRYGSSSSSEERWSRRWSGSHEDRRKGKCRKKYEKPSYNVTCVSSLGYEVRRYEEAVWVTTLVNGSSYDTAKRTGFKRLLRYITGHNNGSVTINMTKPVRKVMEIERDERTNLTRSVMRSVSFFLPREFWDNPPEPLEENVFLERFNASDAFVYNFGGYATEHKVAEKFRRLRHKLEMKEQPFSEGHFEVQAFDPPWIYYRRHNEILIPADSSKGTPSCPEEFPNGIRQCGERECPTYTQIEELSDQIFVRQVAAGVYATKKSTTCNISRVMEETYMPLHEYFEGDNVGSISMPRTIPVLQLGVRPDRTNIRCNFTYQTMFYIPEANQENPPVPNDETIIVSSVGPTQYYVIKFDETLTPKVAFQKYSELRSFLDERALCYFRGIFQLAFYDAPWRPPPHLYELSIPADEACTTEVLEGFEVELFPQNEEGQIRLPLANDEPNPVQYLLG